MTVSTLSKVFYFLFLGVLSINVYQSIHKFLYFIIIFIKVYRFISVKKGNFEEKYFPPKSLEHLNLLLRIF